MSESDMKRCTKCGESKPIEAFNRDAQRADGRSPRCKQCKSAAQRAYYKANCEQIKAKSAEWYRDNHDQALQSRREWYQTNREASLDQRSRRYRANLGDEHETQRKHRAELRRKVFEHYGTSCACCGSIEQLSVDHIDGKGAEHREELWGRRNGGGVQFWRWLINQGFPSGYQTLCMPCNRSKNDGDHCRLDHT